MCCVSSNRIYKECKFKTLTGQVTQFYPCGVNASGSGQSQIHNFWVSVGYKQASKNCNMKNNNG